MPQNPSVSPPRSAWVVSLSLLARRDLSEGEVRARLLDREYPNGEVEETIGKLRQHRYLDDRTLAVEVAGSRARRKLHGPAKVTAHLRRRRFPAELVEEAVRAAFPGETELARARDALQRMRETRTPPDRPGAYRRLANRGFSPEAIREAVADYPGGAPS